MGELELVRVWRDPSFLTVLQESPDSDVFSLVAVEHNDIIDNLPEVLHLAEGLVYPPVVVFTDGGDPIGGSQKLKATMRGDKGSQLLAFLVKRDLVVGVKCDEELCLSLCDICLCRGHRRVAFPAYIIIQSGKIHAHADSL